MAVTWRAWHCHATDVPPSPAKTHQSNLNWWPRDPSPPPLSIPRTPLGSRAPTFTLQSKARPTFQGKQRRTRSRGVPGFPSDTVILCVATSGNDLICTSAAKLNVTAHASCQGLAFAFCKNRCLWFGCCCCLTSSGAPKH